MEILNKKLDGVATSIDRLEKRIDLHEQKDEQFQSVLLNRLDVMENRILQSKATANDAQKNAKKALLAAGKYSVLGMIGGFFAQVLHYVFNR